MAQPVTCPHCETALVVEETAAAGFRCPRCGATIASPATLPSTPSQTRTLPFARLPGKSSNVDRLSPAVEIFVKVCLVAAALLALVGAALVGTLAGYRVTEAIGAPPWATCSCGVLGCLYIVTFGILLVRQTEQGAQQVGCFVLVLFGLVGLGAIGVALLAILLSGPAAFL